MPQDQLSRDRFLQALQHSINFLRGDRHIRKHFCRGRFLAESDEASERKKAEAHFDTSVPRHHGLEYSAWILAPQVACTRAKPRTKSAERTAPAQPEKKRKRGQSG